MATEMSVTNYSRGRAFEYRVRDVLQGMGFWVIRSAGSHGAVDLIAFGSDQTARFVQCKRDGKLSADDETALVKIGKIYGGIPLLALCSKRGVKFYHLTTTGRTEW